MPGNIIGGKSLKTIKASRGSASKEYTAKIRDGAMGLCGFVSFFRVVSGGRYYGSLRYLCDL